MTMQSKLFRRVLGEDFIIKVCFLDESLPPFSLFKLAHRTDSEGSFQSAESQARPWRFWNFEPVGLPLPPWIDMTLAKD